MDLDKNESLSKPLISVVMPVYNCEKYLDFAIESVLNQTYNNWELLITDDASSDLSFSIAHLYSTKDNRIKVYKNKHNLGSLKTRNNLFGLASGELIALQDSDDISERDRFRIQVENFQKDELLMLCGTWATYLSKGKFLKNKQTAISSEAIILNHIQKNQFCSASIMFRKLILNELKGYREYFYDKGNYDYDFTLRVVERYKTINVPEYLYNVRVLVNSNSKVGLFENPLKFESAFIAQKLASQRLHFNGKDFLSESNIKGLKELEEESKEKYYRSPYLIYDKYVNNLIESGFKWEAFVFSLNLLFKMRFRKGVVSICLYSLKKLVF